MLSLMDVILWPVLATGKLPGTENGPSAPQDDQIGLDGGWTSRLGEATVYGRESFDDPFGGGWV